MFAVKPGRKYFWAGDMVRPWNTAPINERYNELLEWVKENVDPEDVSVNGRLVTTVTFHFEKSEDAVAFKLRFGIA